MFLQNLGLLHSGLLVVWYGMVCFVGLFLCGFFFSFE